MNDPRISRVRDPLFHIRHIQGVKSLTRAHERIIKAVRDFNRVGIRACHGIGKTFTLGHIVPWFLTTHSHSKVLTTAPTNRQVNNLLWAEIRSAFNNAKLPMGGEIFETPFWRIAEDWYAIGYSPEKGPQNAREGETSNSSFQGFHAENMLIVIDEATGIPHNMWSQIEGMATSGNVKIVAIGNPTTKNCKFYENFSSRAWQNLSLSCFDSPNLTVNGIYTVDDLRRELDRLLKLDDEEMRRHMARYRVKNPSLVTLYWVMTRAMPDEWGIDSIPFQTRVLGEWPEVEEDVFFPDSVIQAAASREPKKDPVTCRYIGIDPARFGTDKTVITVIENFIVTRRIEMQGKDTSEQAGMITKLIRGFPRVADEKVIVDSTGVGAGVIDQLNQNQQIGLIPEDIQLVELHNGEGPDEPLDPKLKQEKDRERYANMKAKVIDLLAKDIQSQLCLRTSIDVYRREMPSILYSYDNKGRMRVESKDDYKRRTGKQSPDSTESLAYANYGRHIPPNRHKRMPRVTAL